MLKRLLRKRRLLEELFDKHLDLLFELTVLKHPLEFGERDRLLIELCLVGIIVSITQKPLFVEPLNELFITMIAAEEASGAAPP